MAEPLVDTPAPGMRLALCQCFGGNVIARLKGKGMVVALRDFANDESISDRLYTLHAVPSAHGDDYSPWSRALAFYRRSVRSYRTSMCWRRRCLDTEWRDLMMTVWRSSAAKMVTVSGGSGVSVNGEVPVGMNRPRSLAVTGVWVVGDVDQLVASELGDGFLSAVIVDQGFAGGGSGDERGDGGIVERTRQTQAGFVEARHGIVSKERIGPPDQREMVTQVGS